MSLFPFARQPRRAVTSMTRILLIKSVSSVENDDGQV